MYLSASRKGPPQRPPPPPPLPRRASARPSTNTNGFESDTSTPGDQGLSIDWANLSQEDKETFFSWLDDFFAAYRKRLSETSRNSPSAVSSEAPSSELEPSPEPESEPEPELELYDARPPLPARRSTIEVTRSAPVLPPRRSDISRPVTTPQTGRALGLPPPVKRSTRPVINKSTRPVAPSLPECIRCRDYTAVDAHASYFPLHTVSSIPQLASDLTSPFPLLVDKARAITFWLHRNITYDAEAFLTRNLKPSTPESTLATGMAVCEGYAGLFAALASNAGMECVVVSGHGKGYGYVPLPPGSPIPPYTSLHAWNAIRLDDGEWKLVDSCWAGGALDGQGVFQRRFESIHFVASNEEFGRTHFPDPKETWKQFVDNPVSWEEYMSRGGEDATFVGGFGDEEYAIHLLWPRTKVIPPGRTTFYLKRKCEHYREVEAECYVPVMIGKNSANLSMEVDDVNGGWRYEMDVVGGETVTLALVKIINGTDAKGVGRAEYDKARGRQAMEFGLLVQWQVESW